MEKRLCSISLFFMQRQPAKTSVSPRSSSLGTFRAKWMFSQANAKAQEIRELIKNRELNIYICNPRSPVSPYQNYHISVSIRKSAKRGHCTRAEQECCIMTD